MRRLSLAACILLLAACSFPGSVRPAVKIGLSAPFEGLYRDLGYEVLHAVRLAVRQRNEAGGLCGRTLVELVALNDFNEPGEAVSQAGEMAADPGVMAVLGGWSASAARAVYPAYADVGLAIRSPLPDPALAAATTRRQAAEAALIAADDLAARRAAVVAAPDEDDAALAAEFERAFALDGREVVARATPPAGDWAAAVVAARPDVLFVTAEAPLAAEWIARLRGAGYSGEIVGGPGLGSRLVVDIAGQAADGALYVSSYAPVPDDAAFVAGYQALSGGAPPGPVAFWAYSAARALLDEIEGKVGGSFDHGGCALRGRDDLAGAGAGPGQAPDVYRYVIRSGLVFQQP